MTREEAIKVLENPDVSIGVSARIGQDPEYWRKLRPALDMAISALRQQETVAKCNGLNEPLTLDELRKMDVAPVRHGRWLPQVVLGQKAWDCSECKTLGSPHWKWCPICGCRMDLEG